MKSKISIIIPVAPGEHLQSELQKQLSEAPADWEILICASQKPDQSFLDERFRWVKTRDGRAKSLNEGASKATGDYLLFLHADSILTEGTFDKLLQTAGMQKEELYYFDLKFIRISNHNVCPKEAGVLFRCRFLETPFGDQGFFMIKKLFEKYGPYSEDAEYGEDHLLVRKLKKRKIKICPIGIQLYTSPRKYEQGGWIRVTILHQYLWMKQAIEDWWQWRNEKDENSNCSILQNSRSFSSQDETRC